MIPSKKNDQCRFAGTWKASRVARLAGCAVLGVILGGCAFRTQTTGMAVEYNEFIAQTTNRQTVLNILRAREREPMHFSSFSEVFGTVKGSVSPGINAALNGDSAAVTNTDTLVTNTGPNGALASAAATDTLTRVANIGATNVTPSLGVQVTTGTDFKVTANATDEFYKGILNPIPTATAIHYLRQGYPADLLSHLLIGRLEFYALIKDPAGKETFVKLRTLHNAPDDPTASGEFAAAIRCRRLDYQVSRSEASAIPITDLSSLAPMSPELLKRLRAKSDARGNVTYELVSPAQTEFSLLLSRPGECDATRKMLSDAFDAAATGLRLKLRPVESGNAPRDLRPQIDTLRGLYSMSATESVSGSARDTLADPGEVKFNSDGYFNSRLPEGYEGDLVIDLTLRSVEGVIYYLGEYIRYPGLGPKLAGPCGYCLPVIRVEPTSNIARTSRFVEVTYRGVRYAVPLTGSALSPDAGRSSQTISIVQQLLNLNRSSKDLPTTPLVRVAN